LKKQSAQKLKLNVIKRNCSAPIGKNFVTKVLN
jgi:hypothetical protein